MVVRLAPEAQQARVSAPFDIEAYRTRALFPLALEARRIHLPQALSPTLVAFDIEAYKAQASVSPAPEAGQAQTPAPSYIEADKTRALVPFAP